MPKIPGSSLTFWWGFPKKPQPAEAFFLEGAGDGQFSWNALRFPWRLSLDFLETNDARAAAHLNVINRWIRKATGDDPFQIADVISARWQHP